MTATEEMTQAFKMILDPSYAEKSSEERKRIIEAVKGKISSAEKKSTAMAAQAKNETK